MVSKAISESNLTRFVCRLLRIIIETTVMNEPAAGAVDSGGGSAFNGCSVLRPLSITPNVVV